MRVVVKPVDVYGERFQQIMNDPMVKMKKICVYSNPDDGLWDSGAPSRNRQMR